MSVGWLKELGLPPSWPLEVEFDGSPVQETRVPFVRIGNDYGTTLAIERDSGAVWSIDEEGDRPPHFVNSRLSLFLAYLTFYLERRSDLATEEPAVFKIIDAMESELRSADAPAFAFPDCWWSVIFEQTRDGLL